MTRAKRRTGLEGPFPSGRGIGSWALTPTEDEGGHIEGLEAPEVDRVSRGRPAAMAAMEGEEGFSSSLERSRGLGERGDARGELGRARVWIL